MNNLLSSLTIHQLRQAADVKEKIEALNKELTLLLGVSATIATRAPKKGRMSASAKAKIAAAQKARWAEVKAARPLVKQTKTAAQAPVKKRTMSAAAKAKISAAAKARWAKIKASGKKSL
jgi:hypothetical protein